MQKLFLVTERFPYGTSEKSFILPELEELVKYYDVTILSHATRAELDDKENETILIPEVKVINLGIELTWYQKIQYTVKFFFDIDGYKEIIEILKNKVNILQRVYQSISFYALAMENFRLMKKRSLFSKNEETIYYTYWYYYYTYSISKNRKYFPNMKVVARTHRFDLYDEQYSGNRQPFKKNMDKKIDRIFFISEQGKNYYLNKHHLDDCNKYVVSRLGTIGAGILPDSIKKNNNKFCLVSCSRVTSIKRVDLIAEALSYMTEEIEWIHFGDGNEFDKLTGLANNLLKSKKNIKYQLKGFVSNQEIIDYYSKHYVDCFISTSSSEGIPVSIQEAMSFGIPIIATDVGGVSELFDNNGILLDENPSVMEVVKAIEKMIYMDKQEYKSFRSQSYTIWNAKYNAKVNRVEFVYAINKLFNCDV